ncbi:MAG: addiction module protein [Deltaproteobacteria bacterium]|nr:addiction module protein [Deltaproteobacteria bacterium]
MRDAQQILDDSLALAPADRAGVARELLASLDDPVDADAADTWVSEIEARARDIAGGAVALEDRPKVRARLVARLTRR